VTYQVLLDTSSMMYRAFFSMPTSVTDAEGQPVNAVHGYLDMVARLVADRRPDEAVHVYDHDWRPAPRVALYSGYKANRQPDPDALPGQFGVLREVLDALGQPQAEAPGWEAEDAIGAICARLGRRDRVDVVTGDRDLIQLVRDPQVRVLFTVRGVSELRTLDEAGVLERFGVPASRYADFATLRGDASDGLPGVRGVGEKTARALVDAYPDLATLVQDASSPRRTGAPLQRSASLRASIKEAAGYLEAMRRVVPIRTDVTVSSWSGQRDEAALEKLAGKYRLGGPIRRLKAVLAAGPSGVPGVPRTP
jgi:5'-3' exonuclease